MRFEEGGSALGIVQSYDSSVSKWDTQPRGIHDIFEEERIPFFDDQPVFPKRVGFQNTVHFHASQEGTSPNLIPVISSSVSEALGDLEDRHKQFRKLPQKVMNFLLVC